MRSVTPHRAAVAEQFLASECHLRGERDALAAIILGAMTEARDCDSYRSGQDIADAAAAQILARRSSEFTPADDPFGWPTGQAS